MSLLTSLRSIRRFQQLDLPIDQCLNTEFLQNVHLSITSHSVHTSVLSHKNAASAIEVLAVRVIANFEFHDSKYGHIVLRSHFPCDLHFDAPTAHSELEDNPSQKRTEAFKGEFFVLVLIFVLIEQVVPKVRWPLQGLFIANGAFDLLYLGLEVMYLFYGYIQ